MTEALLRRPRVGLERRHLWRDRGQQQPLCVFTRQPQRGGIFMTVGLQSAAYCPLEPLEIDHRNDEIARAAFAVFQHTRNVS